MGRKAARKKVVRIRRVAPTWVTPRLTPGDVLMLIDPDVWLSTGKTSVFKALLYAALAALLACARVKLHQAVEFTLADYRADRLETLNQMGRPYPVVLLPLVAAAIDAYLEKRERLGIGGDFLFVDEEGLQVSQADCHLRFTSQARQCGHYGGQIPERLVDFFDQQFEEERRDLLAVIALRRSLNYVRDGRPDTDRVFAVAADRRRLLKVLTRNHEFAGDAGRFRGGHGKTKARKTARLFLHQMTRRMNPYLRKDPVCARLLTYDWLERNAPRRAEIVRDDLPHLERLLEEKKIRPVDIAYLLCMQTLTTQHLLRGRRLARETSEARKKRQETVRCWHERVVETYRAHAPGGDPWGFFVRMTEQERYPFKFVVLIRSLRKAGLTPKQIAQRTKKRIVGINEKVGKTELAAKVKSRNGGAAGGTKGDQTAPKQLPDTEKASRRV